MFMNVVVWEYRTFDNENFRCGKMCYAISNVMTSFV
jgi:hypothetical protein